MRAGTTHAPETIEKIRETKLAMMAHEANRAPVAAALRRLAADPAERERRRQHMLAQWRDPAFVEQWSRRQRRVLRQPSAEIRGARSERMAALAPRLAEARAAALMRQAESRTVAAELAAERAALLRQAGDALATANLRNKAVQRLSTRLTNDEGWRLQMLRAIGVSRFDALVWIVALHPSVEVAP